MITDPVLPVGLRALEMADLERTWRWHNDPELYRTLEGLFRPVSHATEEVWLRGVIEPSAQQACYAICTASDLTHIGNLYLRDIDWVSRHAELHLFIGDIGKRGNGYGQAAIRLIQHYARESLGLHRLFLEVLADNAPAVHVYEKCGFRPEGRLREHVFKDGTFKDLLTMGCLLCSLPTNTTRDEMQTANR